MPSWNNEETSSKEECEVVSMDMGLMSQDDIIKNTRKAMKDVEVDRDVLKKEKAKLELVVAELLKDGYGCKEKLKQIKAILES
ncbi:hypothetical protein VPH35_080111 [Triticum aestivum]